MVLPGQESFGVDGEMGRRRGGGDDAGGGSLVGVDVEEVEAVPLYDGNSSSPSC